MYNPLNDLSTINDEALGRQLGAVGDSQASPKKAETDNQKFALTQTEV